MNRRFLLSAVAASGLALTLSSGAVAQSNYPNKPITMVVAFAAGGPTDVIARMVSEHMSRTLGQQIIV
ncbi:MAG: tripartite tricarboxylate transporter substrate binding protein BugD, partial [Bosea sp. (in: a-proteobacteria)]